ncbi:MAG: TonB-dependent receptor [Dysgonamonadaceae bacterium]|nr:TonB-dependent receptor [Dysgonamonadaceae bacterium]
MNKPFNVPKNKLMDRVCTLCAFVLLLAVCLCPVYAQQQTEKTITGTVEDERGTPIIGANIMIKGATTGVVSDIDGRFSLQAPLGASITVSYLGFVSQTVTVGNQTSFHVVLQENLQQLSEVVVVGYGMQKKTSVTGAVSQISSKELTTAPSGNLSSLLQGRLSGLVTKQYSGQPGADGASLYVRGIGAGDGNVLVVVDGVIRAFPDINPEEIESISILKDATAAAVYGVRASAGVIIITTKRGKTQKPTITLHSAVSISQNTSFPEFLHGADYAYWYDKAQELDGIPEANRRFTQDEINRLRNGDPQGIYSDMDWFGLVFENYAPTYTNNLSLTGGNNDFKYFVSLGAYNQRGVVTSANFDRFNLRTNIDANVTKNLSVNIGLGLRQSTTEEPGVATSWVFQSAMLAYPIIAPVTVSGQPTATANLEGNGNQNPVAARDLSGSRVTAEKRMEGNMGFDYKIPFVNGLKAKVNLAYDTMYRTFKRELLAYKVQVYNQATKTWTEQYARHLTTGESRVDQTFAEQYNYTLQPSLEYANTFGKHDIQALFLYEYAYTRYNDLLAARQNFPVTDIMDLNFGEEVIADAVGGGHSINKRAGYVGRINYAYDNKYLLELTARYDGTPYLPAKNRWGLFPGVSAGWRISEEPFLKDTFEAVDNLKLRASAGRLGSDAALGYSYSYMSMVSMSQTPIVMIGNELKRYMGISSPPNLNLEWQVNDTYNAGVELSLWKQLLGVELDVFYMKTSRTLESQSNYPPSAGDYYPRLINYGKHENKGFELVLTHRNQVRDFQYNGRCNLSYARNKILKRTEDPNLPASLRSTGRAMGQVFGFVSDGLFQSAEEISNSPVYGPTLPGEIKLVDINGDGRITWDQDRVPIGRSNIPEMMFGLNLGANYKHFDASLFFQGASLFDVYLCGMYADRGFMDDTFYTRAFFADGNAPYYLVNGAWTPEHTNAQYPRLSTQIRTNGGKYSDWWIEDGTYLRLKSAQIGYTIPASISKGVGIEKVRLAVSGSNLFTLTGLKYLDPEMPNVNQGYYPQQRVYEFSLNVTF